MNRHMELVNTKVYVFIGITSSADRGDLISVQHYSARFKRTLCLRNHARRGCCFTHEWLSRYNQLGLSSQQRDIIPAYVRCLQRGTTEAQTLESI